MAFASPKGTLNSCLVALWMTNVRVFGSIARGEDTDNSDIDLLVDAPDNGTLLDMVKLKYALELEIGTQVDVLTPDDLKTKHPNIEWHAIAGMRHRLVHDYNGVNLKLIWNTVKTMVPEFKVSVTKIQAEINVEDGSGGQASGGPSARSVIPKPR